MLKWAQDFIWSEKIVFQKVAVLVASAHKSLINKEKNFHCWVWHAHFSKGGKILFSMVILLWSIGGIILKFDTHFFLFARHGLNVPVLLRPTALPVVLVITSKGQSSSACRTLMSFLCGLVIDLAISVLSGLVSWNDSTPANCCESWFCGQTQYCHL